MKGYIYKFTSPSNKVYIGLTKNLKERLNDHKNLANKNNRPLYKAIRKYGYDNLKFEILEIIQADNENMLYEKMNKREIYYIDKYNSFKNGYNCTLGGDGTKGVSGELNPFYNKKHSEETKKLMRELKIGKSLSNEHKENISRGTKKALSNLSYEQKQKMIEGARKNKFKKVICLDTNKIYDSVTECANDFNCTTTDISSVCNGKRITAKGHRFRYYNNGIVEVDEPPNNKVRAIICIETGQEFESIKSACEVLNVRHQHISAILRGKQKTTKGYSFKYK